MEYPIESFNKCNQIQMWNKTLKAIESSIVKDKTVLTFSDNGIGIDLKIKIKVFGLYQRFHDYRIVKDLGYI
jgi:light-regulated signal transduction histidine kinase (bacteriophytochrome)